MTDVSKNLDYIYTPTFVVQARKDEMIDPKSAEVIHEQVESDIKQIKWYEQSGHSITIGPEKEQLHQDIYQFLEKLDEYVCGKFTTTCTRNFQKNSTVRH